MYRTKLPGHGVVTVAEVAAPSRRCEVQVLAQLDGREVGTAAWTERDWTASTPVFLAMEAGLAAPPLALALLAELGRLVAETGAQVLRVPAGLCAGLPTVPGTDIVRVPLDARVLGLELLAESTDEAYHRLAARWRVTAGQALAGTDTRLVLALDAAIRHCAARPLKLADLEPASLAPVAEFCDEGDDERSRPWQHLADLLGVASPDLAVVRAALTAVYAVHAAGAGLARLVPDYADRTLKGQDVLRQTAYELSLLAPAAALAALLRGRDELGAQAQVSGWLGRVLELRAELGLPRADGGLLEHLGTIVDGGHARHRSCA